MFKYLGEFNPYPAKPEYSRSSTQCQYPQRRDNAQFVWQCWQSSLFLSDSTMSQHWTRF